MKKVRWYAESIDFPPGIFWNYDEIGNGDMKKFCEKKIKNPSYHKIIHINRCITPVTILLGPNGTGKSMSLLTIENDCKKQNINCIKYSNKHNDIVNTAFDFEPWKLACAFHSEGERICDSIDNWADSDMLKNLLTNQDNLYILIDELDSGLSKDRLMLQINMYLSILDLEKEKHPNRDVKFIFTCNTYEMLECFEKCGNKVSALWVPTGKRLDLKHFSYLNFSVMYKDYYNYMKTKEEESL